MPKQKRFRTDYPGVFFIVGDGARGPEKIYYVVYRRDGKVIEEKAGWQFKNDMTPARAAGIRAQRTDGREPSNKEIRVAKKKAKDEAADKWTLDRLWAHYCDAKKELVKGLSTDKYRYDKFLKDPLGNKEPRSIIDLDIKRLVHSKTVKELSPQTRKHILALLIRISNYGVRERLCAGLSVTIEKPEVSNEKTEHLTPEQIKKLVDALEADKSPIAKAVLFALYTGCRKSEILRLTWSRVDFDNNRILITNRKGRKGGRSGPDLNVHMTPVLRELLESIPRTDGLVFPGENGAVWSETRHVTNRVRKAAGLPKSFRPWHGLRHSFASMLVSQGESLYTVQALLGHNNPQTTKRYSHLTDTALKNASLKAASLINNASGSSQKSA